MSTWFASYSCSEVHPDLLVGAYPLDGADVATLRRLGVQRVLNLVEDSEYQPGDREALAAGYAQAQITERRLSLVDFGRLPADRIEEAVTIIVDSVRADQRTYVHCRAGRQRSAAIAAGAVSVLEGIPIDEALAVVRRRRPAANPLPHQRADLTEWWQQRGARAAG